MAPGTWTWSDRFAGPIHLPVYPSESSGDLFVLPPGMLPGSASTLLLRWSFWDPSLTPQFPQTSQTNRGVGIYFVDADSVEWAVQVSGGGGNLVSGGQNAYFTSGVVQTGSLGFPSAPFPAVPPLLTLADYPAFLNRGGTFRYRASADRTACDVHFVAVAAALSADGLTGANTQTFLVNFPSLWGGGVFSGVVTTSPPPGGRDDVAFIAGVMGVQFDSHNQPVDASPPDFTLDPGWANAVVASYHATWAGIGYLIAVSPPPATTDTFSMYVPVQAVAGFTSVIFVYRTVIVGGGSVQVVG